MCCLYGVYNYGKEVTKLSGLINTLSLYATARGTDATGVAYNNKGHLAIYKEPKSADDIEFKIPEGVRCVTGHTRRATQGAVKKNYNNHPFFGSCKNLKFALAHNGIISNDDILKSTYKLPKTKIETDSYIAVQLLEYKKNLDAKSIRFMAEEVMGSYSFTILDSSDTLWLVKGDSPLSIVHFPRLKLYVYASTDEILLQALACTLLAKELKRGMAEEIKISEGDILSFTPDGEIHSDRFEYVDLYFMHRSWYDYPCYDDGLYHTVDYDGNYPIDDLKRIALRMGYSGDTVDELLNEGYSPEEIEDFIYCTE